MTTVGVDPCQPRLRDGAIVPSSIAHRITALGRERSSAGLARLRRKTVPVVNIDREDDTAETKRRRASC